MKHLSIVSLISFALLLVQVIHTIPQCPSNSAVLIKPLSKKIPWANVDYNWNRVHVFGPNSFTIKMKIAGTKNGYTPMGGRISSKKRYLRGKVTATIKSGADIPGLLSAFYLSDDEPLPGAPRLQDEVDFEFMGHQKIEGKLNVVQTGEFVNGEHGWGELSGVQIHEFDHRRPLTYTMKWEPTKAWLTIRDGKKKFTRVIVPHKETWAPMRVYFSFWGPSLCDAYWNPSLVNWCDLVSPEHIGKEFTMKVTNIKFEDMVEA